MTEGTAFTSLGWQALIVMKRLKDARRLSSTGTPQPANKPRSERDDEVANKDRERERFDRQGSRREVRGS